MTAGILSYQLCDRKFDCDHCPLDAAMRKHYQPSQTEPPRAEQRDRGRADLRDDYLYSGRHCWVRRRSKALVRVGIEPGLAGILMAPKAIAFPSVGETIGKGQVCLWIITEGGTFPVYSPLSGRVWAVNSLLTEKPHKLEQHPYDQGWLFDLNVEQDVDGINELLNKERACEQFRRDDERWKELLGQAISKNRPAVGVTLADGGLMLHQVADILGPQRYFSILSRVFC